MKILYYTSNPLPSRRSNRIQIIKMCEALSYLADVVLAIDEIKGEIKKRYNLKRNFEIIELKYSGRLKSLVYAWKLSGVLKQIQPDILFIHDRFLLFGVSFLKRLGLTRNLPKIITEIHQVFDRNLLDRLVDRFYIPRVDYFVFLTKYIGEYYIKRFKIDPRKTIALPNGVDLELFNTGLNKQEARQRLGLPINKKIIGWLGNFREQKADKGLINIFKAAKMLNNSDYLFLFIGGDEKDHKDYQPIVKKFGVQDWVRFVGYVPFNRVPIYLRSTDLVLMPFSWTRHYAYHMSPHKLFDYLASQRPLISSDLPCLRSILNKKNCVFCKPGDARDLADKIKYVLNSPDLAKKIVKQASEDIKKYTWLARAKRIIELIS